MAAVIVPTDRPDPVAAERQQRADRALLILSIDPGYVDPDYGRHTADCWSEAHPLGECWCNGQVPDSGAVTLAAFAAAVGGAA